MHRLKCNLRYVELDLVLKRNFSNIIYCSCFRTINSEYDQINFSVIPGQAAVSLSITCADLVDHVSRLDNNALSYLGQLQDLAISHCKLSSLPSLSLSGLDRLYNLTINTHPDPDHEVSLEIEAGALAGLHHLTSLDLSYSAIWRIPDQNLCNLRSLTFLNVSNNNIKDVKDVGFSSDDR